MQRSSITAEIFGYLVCLLTVAVFFISVAGIVNGAFRVVNPTAQPHMLARHLGAAGPGHHGDAFFWMGHAGHGEEAFGQMGPGAGASAGPMMGGSGNVTGSPGPDIATMRARFTADARYDAARRLLVAIVMLILSIAVFRRTFDWLNPKQPA